MDLPGFMCVELENFQNANILTNTIQFFNFFLLLCLPGSFIFNSFGGDYTLFVMLQFCGDWLNLIYSYVNWAAEQFMSGECIRLTCMYNENMEAR
jgi:hypothetical protein